MSIFPFIIALLQLELSDSRHLTSLDLVKIGAVQLQKWLPTFLLAAI